MENNNRLDEIEAKLDRAIKLLEKLAASHMQPVVTTQQLEHYRSKQKMIAKLVPRWYDNFDIQKNLD